MWCIAKITPEYKKRMYDVLDLYNEPHDPKRPVICFDEKPKQLLADSRPPIPTKKGKPKKYDYEYERNGTANIFIAVEPKAGKRKTKVTKRRTKKETVQYIKELANDYPKASVLRIVADNLNTHKKEAFYDVLSTKQADKLSKKIEFHYTPKHASWLNMAEIEISVMDSQCTGTRIPSQNELAKQVAAWTKKRNQKKIKINWTFTKQKARKKLSKHYVQKPKG